MNDAWFEGAKAVDFNGITQAQFLADITDAATDDATIADLEAELKMKTQSKRKTNYRSHRHQVPNMNVTK